jgi:hypothetical protein
MFEYYKKLFEQLHVPQNIIYKIIPNQLIFYKKYANKEINGMIGGSKIINYTYTNYKFKIYNYEEDDRITFAIHDDSNEEKQYCVLLFIPLYEKVRYVHIETISNLNKCAVNGMPKIKGGSLLLKTTLSFINSIKELYKLKFVHLLDNSMIFCKLSETKIELDNLLILTTGDTWYGKYGFIPYDEDKMSTDIEKYTEYIVNQKLVDRIKIRNTDIISIIINTIKKFNKYETKYDISYDFFEKYKNHTVKKFFSEFMKDYDNKCELFSVIYKKVMDEIGIYNLHNMSYYKLL